MRRAFASLLSARGLSGRPRPVRASTRMTVPPRPTGSSPANRSCARNAPPSAVGGTSWDPYVTRGIAAGVGGVASLPVVRELVERRISSAHVEGSVATEVNVAYRMGIRLLTPVLDEHPLPAGPSVASSREHREPATCYAAILQDSRWVGALVDTSARRPLRRRTADWSVVRVSHVDEGLPREVGVQGEPEEPEIPDVVDVG